MPKKSSAKSTPVVSQADLAAIKQELGKLSPKKSAARSTTQPTAPSAPVEQLPEEEVVKDEAPAVAEQQVEKEKEETEEVRDLGDELSPDLHTFRWFTAEIDRLRERIRALEAEKEKGQVEAVDQGAIEQLQLENAALREENAGLREQLQQSQSRLEAIGQFLSTGGGVSAVSSSPASSAEGVSSAPVPAASSNGKGKGDRSMKKGTASKREEQGVGELDADVVRALDLLMEFNNAEGREHQERWAISIPVMKDLLRQIGKATQPKIEAVLKARAKEIEAHHKEHGLGERHNRVHGGRSVSEVVKLGDGST